MKDRLDFFLDFVIAVGGLEMDQDRPFTRVEMFDRAEFGRKRKRSLDGKRGFRRTGQGGDGISPDRRHGENKHDEERKNKLRP